MTETIRYSTTVTSVGSLVADFVGQGMLIIFGEGAPSELHDMCALHTPDVKDGGVQPGDRLLLDDQQFTVLSVGDVANANLTALGHVSFKANGATTAQLPGDISVEERPLPVPREGSRVVIVAGDRSN
jgi:PTS system glucitol/sorbitol-specific IIA component